MQTALLQGIRQEGKCVWLCSSELKATRLRDAVKQWLAANGLAGHPTWLLTALGDEIDEFRHATTGHLFVAGRFDGMDFSGDECRIVVMSTMPNAINLQEEFLATYLRDSGFMRRRLNQRVVQGLGRCTRNDDDFGVYFLADQRFATHFSRDSNRVGIPQHITAEIDLGQDLAEVSATDLTKYVVRFLGGDFGQYDADLAERAAELPLSSPTGGEVTDTSKDEVIGWAALFRSENYTVAQRQFQRCWEQSVEDKLFEIAALHGWHLAKACYLDARRDNRPGGIDRAIGVLEKAVERGGRSAWFNRMRTSIGREREGDQATQAVIEEEFAEGMIGTFDNHLERLGTSGPKFQKFVNRIDEALDAENHASFVEGLEELGRLLGYEARRPTHSASTDCTWRANTGYAREVFTLEAKIDHHPSNMITVSDIGQASAQNNRAREEFGGRGYAVRSLIVTHLTTVSPDGGSSLGVIRLVSRDAVMALWRHIRHCLINYRANWSLDNVRARRACANAIRPRLPASGWLLRAVDRADPWLSEAALLKEWST